MGRFRALSYHDFRLLFLGQLVSMTGTQMQHVAVLWQLYMLTRSPVSLGMIGLFRVAPILLFAAFGGVIADAIDRRKLMILTQSALACSTLILLAATITGHISPPMIYGVLFFSGMAIAFDAPARAALLPQLVSKEDLPNALSLMTMAWQLAAIGGPAIAGFAIDRFGIIPIYIADVASFLVVIGALLAMRHRAAPIVKTTISIQAAVEGLTFIKNSPILWSAMLLDFFATFFAGSLLLMPIFAQELLNVGTEGLGILFAAQPCGAAIAAAILSSLPPIVRQGRVLLVAVVIYGVSIVGFGLSPWIALSFLMLAISGAADTVSMVIRQTIRQLHTPDELRGRMTSVNMVFFMGGPQLGEFEAGLVAKVFGPRVSVASGGVACIVATLLIGKFMPVLRRYVFKPSEG